MCDMEGAETDIDGASLAADASGDENQDDTEVRAQSLQTSLVASPETILVMHAQAVLEWFARVHAFCAHALFLQAHLPAAWHLIS